MILREYTQGFFVVWIVLSLITLFILAAPFVLPENTIYSLLPVCQSKLLTGKECPLCGMTSAFLTISKGNFPEAYLLNHGSLILYFLLAANQLVFYVVMFSRYAYRKASSKIFVRS